MPQAIVTVGIPGSGKSHFASQQPDTWVEVNLDACRLAVSGDAGNQACTADAVALHTRFVDAAIALGRDLIVSDTNLSPVFRDQLVAKLRDAGYDVDVRVIDTPFVLCQARNLARAQGRQVPFHAMSRMWQSMLDQGLTTA